MKKTVFFPLLVFLATGAQSLFGIESHLVVRGLVGTASFRGVGESAYRVLRISQRLTAGMHIRTDDGSRVKLVFSDSERAEIVLRERTTLRIDTLLVEAGKHRSDFFLPTGRFKAVVVGLIGADVKVRTETAVAGVRGTEFGVEADGPAGTSVYTFSGNVEVQGLAAGQPVGLPSELPAGKKAAFAAGGMPGAVEPVTDADSNRFEATLRGGETAPVDQETPPERGAVSPERGIRPEETPLPPAGFSWAGAIGPEVIGDRTWTKLVLAPRVNFGRFVLAFYLPIYYDANAGKIWEQSKWYNSEEWNFGSFKDFLHDLLLKFYYVQYGLDRETEPVFLRLGSNDDFTIGNGLLMNRYNNAVGFPEVRKVGLDMKLETSWGGLEFMSADIYEAAVFGARVFVKPFGGLFDRFAIGLSAVGDWEPTGSREDAPVAAGICLDMMLPLPELGPFSWRLFADYARLGHQVRGTYAAVAYGTNQSAAERGLEFDDGYGISFGLKGRLSIMHWLLGYRILKGGFIPEYFDGSYDANRQARIDELLFAGREDYTGPIFELGADFWGYAGVAVRFQRYGGNNSGGETSDNRLQMFFHVNRGVVPSFRFTFAYDRANLTVGELFDDLFGANTVTTAKIFYEVSAGVEIVTIYRRFYSSDGSYVENYGLETQMGL
jgi:hypothetical protein